MAQADGTIVIDTEIRADGAKPGMKEIENACKRSAATVQELGTNVEKSILSMIDLGNKSGTTADSVNSLSEDLVSMSDATQKLGDSADVAAGSMQKVGDQAKEISAPVDDLGKKSESTAQKLQSAGDKMKTVGTGLTAGITAPLALAGKSMIDAASDFDENLNKVNVAFGNSSEAVTAWADNATKQFGLSKNQALEATSLFGDMGTAMGITQSEAADMSTSLAGLAGDLASFKNIDIEQAMTALSGVFTGETESLKQLGIVMTETNLEEFAAKTGKVYSEMGQAEKVQLRYNYVMEMTKNAQGDYARTSDGTANSLRTLQGSVDNLSIALGQNLLPIITPIINKMTEMVNKFSEMSPGAQQFILVMAGVAAAIGPVLIIVGQLVSTVGKISPLFSQASGMVGGFSKILGVLTGPVGLVVAAIASLAAVFAYLFATNESFRESIMSTAQTLGEAFKPVLDALLPVLTNLAAIIGETLGNVLQALAPILAQIIELAGTLLAKLGEFITWALENILPVLQPIIEFLANAVISFFDTLSNVISSILETLSGIIDFLVGVFTGDWELAWTGIQEIFSGVWELITGILSSAWEFITTLITNALDVVKEVISTGWNGIKTLTSSVWKTIENILSTTWDTLKNLASSAFEAIGDTISSIWETIQDVTGDIWNGIQDTISGIVESISDKVSSVFEGMRDAVSGIFESLVGLVKSPLNTIIDFLNRLIGAAQNAWNTIADFLSFSIDIPWPISELTGWGSFSLSVPRIDGNFSLPYLASGAVIPPNSPFMAVLGDQNRGTNIEAPLETIKKAVRDVVGENTGGVYHVSADVSGRTLLDIVIDEAELRQRRNGSNPFMLA